MMVKIYQLFAEEAFEHNGEDENSPSSTAITTTTKSSKIVPKAMKHTVVYVDDSE